MAIKTTVTRQDARNEAEATMVGARRISKTLNWAHVTVLAVVAVSGGWDVRADKTT